MRRLVQHLHSTNARRRHAGRVLSSLCFYERYYEKGTCPEPMTLTRDVFPDAWSHGILAQMEEGKAKNCRAPGDQSQKSLHVWKRTVY